jgi:hypothetical protein
MIDHKEGIQKNGECMQSTNCNKPPGMAHTQFETPKETRIIKQQTSLFDKEA